MYAVNFLSRSKLHHEKFRKARLIPCQVCIFIIRSCDNIIFQSVEKTGVILAVSNYRVFQITGILLYLSGIETPSSLSSLLC